MSSILPAFEDSAQEFSDRLSSLFTETITPYPLQPIIRPDRAYIAFRGAAGFRDRPSVELPNGCWIRVSQTILPNPEVPSGITTMEYLYAYALGPNPKTDWLVRYDYSPHRPTKYPVAHVHFNGISDAYNNFHGARDTSLSDVHFPTDRITAEDFIEHLIIEYDTPTHGSKTEALEFLAESRRKFHEQDRTRHPPY